MVFITVQNLVGIDAVVLIIIMHVYRFREFGLKTPIQAQKLFLGFLTP